MRKDADAPLRRRYRNVLRFPVLPSVRLQEEVAQHVVGNAPPPLRLTFTLPLINRAARIHFLVAGAAKAEAVRATLEGPYEPSQFPAQGVRPMNGTATWWVDRQAAAALKASL